MHFIPMVAFGGKDPNRGHTIPLRMAEPEGFARSEPQNRSRGGTASGTGNPFALT